MDGVIRGIPSGRVGGVVGGLPAAPPPPAAIPTRAYEQAAGQQARATAAALGDLFEYRIKEAVTLQKNQSALVPIVSAEIAAEKVALWNRLGGSGRPLRAVWLTNNSGLTLDGGTISELAGIEHQLATLNSQLQGIVADQQRLRENMKALRGSAEEKSLLQRYTRQLDDQEDKLDALRLEMANTAVLLETARQEFNRLLEAFEYEG